MCARCGRDDGTALLPSRRATFCPRCWIGVRRRANVVGICAGAVLVAMVAVLDSLAFVAGLVTGLVATPLVLLAGLLVTFRLLRWRVLRARYGDGPLYWHRGTSPRCEVRRPRPATWGIEYAPRGAISAGAHRAVAVVPRLVVITAALAVYVATRAEFVRGLTFAVAASLVWGALTARPSAVTAGQAAAANAAIDAHVRVRRGDLDGALAVAAAATGQAPDDTPVAEAHADVLLATGDHAAAADRVDRLFEDAPPAHRAALAATFAWAVAEGGLIDRSAEAWQAVRYALTTAPVADPALVAFAALLDRNGMPEDASLLVAYVRRHAVEEAWYERAVQWPRTPRS
jgi:hypothetical protein